MASMLGSKTNPVITSTTADCREDLILPPAHDWLQSPSAQHHQLCLDRVLEHPQIFIGSAASAGSRALLEAHKIGVMLSLVPQPFEDETFSQDAGDKFERYRVVTSRCPGFHGLDVHRYLITLSDDEKNPPEKLREAFDLLRWLCKEHGDSRPILVHCQGGMSRSVSLVAALIAKYSGCSFQEAVHEVGYHRGADINEKLAESLVRAIGIPFDKF